MKSRYYVVIIVVVVFLFAAPLILFPSASFGGADSGAEQAISDSGYVPWFTSIWTPPSSEIETLLFSLQAAIGALIIGYFIGNERGKRAKNKEVSTTSTAGNEKA
jgi:cobalt/nickel transport protein